jgi:hypothetical protein
VSSAGGTTSSNVICLKAALAYVQRRLAEQGNGPERDYDLLKFWNVEADQDPYLFDFAKTVWLLLQIPASESAAERAFSVL